jgi:hypothetical protein
MVAPQLFVLRLVATLMVAAAAGAVAAIVATSIAVASRPDWLRSLSTSALEVAAVLACGALGALLTMPSRTELVRRRPSDGMSKSWSVLVLVAGLAAIAFVQLPPLTTWFREELGLLSDLRGGGPDPLGLTAIPGGVLLSQPVLSVLGLVAFVLTSLLVPAVRADLTTRALAACLMLQGGLVGALHLTGREVRAIALFIQQFVDSASDAAMSARLAQIAAQYEGTASAFRTRLTWIFAAYVVALAVTRVEGSRRRPAAPTGSPAIAAHGPAPILGRPIVRGSAAAASLASSAASAFASSAYSVRPRGTWMNPFVLAHSEFDIAPIPPTARERFCLSFTTGAIRRVPDGPRLWLVETLRDGLLGGRSYRVADARTGTVAGLLAPDGPDWDIRDAAGQTLARVLEIEEGAGLAKYEARAGGEVVCRFVWGFLGWTAASAELQIEFVPGVDARFDRALAIVLGAVLENRARRVSRRYS